MSSWYIGVHQHSVSDSQILSVQHRQHQHHPHYLPHPGVTLQAVVSTHSSDSHSQDRSYIRTHQQPFHAASDMRHLSHHQSHQPLSSITLGSGGDDFNAKYTTGTTPKTTSGQDIPGLDLSSTVLSADSFAVALGSPDSPISHMLPESPSQHTISPMIPASFSVPNTMASKDQSDISRNDADRRGVDLFLFTPLAPQAISDLASGHANSTISMANP
ncbi:unnamed protein product, partial [Protopolystoma xenopodis]